jgi:uncharacterized membrane protein
MQTHLGMIQFGSVVAIALLVGALMIGSYLAAVSVLMSAFVLGCAYLIGAAEFEEHERQPSRRAP